MFSVMAQSVVEFWAFLLIRKAWTPPGYCSAGFKFLDCGVRFQSLTVLPDGTVYPELSKPWYSYQ
jgi:hypothetical protein